MKTSEFQSSFLTLKTAADKNSVLVAVLELLMILHDLPQQMDLAACFVNC